MGTRKGTVRQPEDGSEKDPRFAACLKMLERTGMAGFNIGFHDELRPIVWVAQVIYESERTPQTEGAECAAGNSPLTAMIRLCEQVVDGARCTHCDRVTALDSEWRIDMPLEDVVCWYRYDPETQEFRRGCA